MSKIVNIITDAIIEGICGGSTYDIKKILSKLDECKVKVYRENKTKPLPIYSKEGDACMDIYATSIEYDMEKDRYIVHTGLHFELPEDYEMEIRPRSSNSKTEWYIPNSPSTIDWGYRGEVLIVFKCRTHSIIKSSLNYILHELRNILKFHDRNTYTTETHISSAQDLLKDFPYKVGDRVCQLIVRRRERIIWDEVQSLDELSKTERGNGGFGHTGK